MQGPVSTVAQGIHELHNDDRHTEHTGAALVQAVLKGRCVSQYHITSSKCLLLCVHQNDNNTIKCLANFSWREETKELIASVWRGLAAEQCVPLKRPPGLQRATKPRAGHVGHHGRRPHVLARCASDSWGLSPGKLQSCMLMSTGLPLKPFNSCKRLVSKYSAFLDA